MKNTEDTPKIRFGYKQVGNEVIRTIYHQDEFEDWWAVSIESIGEIKKTA